MIWPQVITTATLAAMAGALAVPAARKVVLGSVKHDWLQDELELDRIEPDGVTIRGKDGSLTRVWRLDGTSYDAKVEQEQHSLLCGRTALLHRLGGEGLSIRFYAVKRKRPIHCAAEWPARALSEIGAAESRQFTESYRIDWYLAATGRTMKPLLEAEQLLPAIAAVYTPELVQAAPAGQLCPLTGFLNGLVCGDYRDDVPALSVALSGALPASDLTFDRTGLITACVPEKRLHRIIAVREWPEQTSGQLIQQVLALPGDIEISQVCEPWDRDKALLLFKRQQMGQVRAIFGNPSQIGETEAILNLLNEGTASLFVSQFQIVARATTERDLNALVASICETLGHRRVLYNVETAGAPVCWFSRIPSLDRGKQISPGGRLLRPLTIRDQNIAALWAWPRSAGGLLSSQFGPQPVRWFRTPAGQAYAFQFHVADKPQARGNYLVFAPTGGGKSTLLMHLLGGLAKFPGIRSYIFDSKEGTRYMVEAMGGVYQSYDTLALNPLDVGEDSRKNRQRVLGILRALAGNETLTASDKAEIDHAANLAFEIETPERTLSNLFPFAFAKRSALRQQFAKWVVDEKGNVGQHSHVFNAAHDSLGGVLNHFMVAINMNEALDDPELGPPVVGHIAEAIGKSAARDARGFTIFIDEAAKLLRNPGFRDLAAEMFREYRKLNGAVGMAFQDPAALLRSGMAEAFIENTATFIFLPNALASAESLEPFKLNDEQMTFILGGSAGGRGKRQALIVKRDGATGYDESAIIDIDLSPLGDALRFYRSGPDANAIIDELRATWGDDWQNHL